MATTKPNTMTIQEAKDIIAKKHGYESWKGIGLIKQSQYVDEVIFEVHKQTAEAQRVLCSNEYKKQKDGFWLGINDNILNCESPKIK